MTAAQFPILTRNLEPQEYAVVVGAIAAAGYVNLASAQPYMLAFQRFAGTPEEPGTYQYSQTRTLTALFILWLAGVALGLVGGHTAVIFAVLGWGTGLAIQNVTTAAWLMWHRPWRYALQMSVVNVIRTSVLVTMILLDSSPLAALLVAGIASAMTGLLTGPHPRLYSRGLNRPWAASFPWTLGGASVAILTLTSTNRIVLPITSDGVSVGQYAAMDTLASLTLGSLLGIITPSVFPEVMRLWNADGETTRLKDVLSLTEQGIAVLTLLGIVLVAIAQPLVEVLSTPEYFNPMYLSMSVAACGLMALSNVSIWKHKLHMRQARVLILSIAVALGHLCAVILTTPLWGVLPALLSLVTALVAYALLLQAGTRAAPSTIACIVGVGAVGWTASVSATATYLAAAATLLAFSISMIPLIFRVFWGARA
jgi:O-antigen/teichoic acid export membrane protein